MIVLSWHQWLAVALTIFVLLVATAIAVNFFLDEFLWEHLRAERLEQQYGFRGGRVPVVSESGQSYGVYVLVEVVKGGPLHEAGFEAGDAPSGGMHSQSVAFLRGLDESCTYPGRKVSVHKVGPSGLDWETGRQLTLPCVR